MEPVPFHSMELEFPCSSSIPWNWNFHVPFHSMGSMGLGLHRLEWNWNFQSHSMFHWVPWVWVPVPFQFHATRLSSIPVPFHAARVPFQFHSSSIWFHGTGMELEWNYGKWNRRPSLVVSRLSHRLAIPCSEEEAPWTFETTSPHHCAGHWYAGSCLP